MTVRRRRLIAVLLTLCAVIAAGYGVYKAYMVPTAPPASGNPMAALGIMLLEDADGLFVLAVTDNSPAARAGIEPGDRLTMADGVALTSISQLEMLIDNRTASSPMPLMVRRSDGDRTIDLRWRQ